MRKSVEATALAERKLKRQASRKQSTLREATLEHSAWIVVPLEPVFSRVDSYLLPGGAGGNTQRELGLSSAIRKSANRLVAEAPAVAKKRATQR